MTPAESRYVERKVDEEVQAQAKFHLNLALGVMRACGARIGI